MVRLIAFGAGSFTCNNCPVFHVEQNRHARTSPGRRPKSAEPAVQRMADLPTRRSHRRLLDATSRQLHSDEARVLNHHSDETPGCGWVGETTT
ncbi:hypothetical protein RHA1_ro03658 [Rhodococcus jostii RHA1]|uniref:Uncharacterized protein n=1 Tax=Rhodococcus jostii (strain RHA1) TaxID=101510 RepID=Q0SAH5_RHOJR|nr:hypothetical protein RHA1_ro03658 [Rhodococcus jostii RHA1]